MLATGCGAQEAPDPAPNLFGEYTKSLTVRADRFRSTGGSSEDRLANFAAHYSVEQLQARVLLAFPCSADGQDSLSGAFFDTSCTLSAPVTETIKQLGSSVDKTSGRVVIVKHDDDSLELVTLFVAAGHAIDSTGQTYTGLDDFRANNTLLTSSDIMLAPANLTKVPGEGDIVTVYAHTKPTWPLYALSAAAAALVLAVLATALVRRRRRSHRPV
jgi:hypothetical protein